MCKRKGDKFVRVILRVFGFVGISILRERREEKERERESYIRLFFAMCNELMVIFVIYVLRKLTCDVCCLEY